MDGLIKKLIERLEELRARNEWMSRKEIDRWRRIFETAAPDGVFSVSVGEFELTTRLPVVALTDVVMKVMEKGAP